MKIKPFSRRQLQVLTWWVCPKTKDKYNAVIADGSIRSGKTMSMSLSFVLWATSNFDGCNFAICGKTVGSCRRNVVKPLLDMIRTRFKITDKRSENLIVIQHGNRKNYFYLFGGKDESSQDLIQGITLAGVMLDEVALMPRSFVEQALGRCSVTGSRFWFNCNPDNPFHWFYQEWIQQAASKQALYLHFTMDDNLTLSQEVKNRYYAMYSGNFFERYILGKWVSAEGLVYPMFNKDKCVVPSDERHYSQYYVSCDYGTLNPFSAGLWGKSGNVWYRIKEYYYDGRSTKVQKTDEEYYSEVVKLIDKLPITAIIVDPSAASFIAVVRKHGRYTVRKADNAVLDGIRLTATCIQQGKIMFNDCCTNTCAEFASYVWDTRHAQKTGEDKPLKEHDHAMDDIRYFCNTVLAHDGLPGVVMTRR